MHVLLDVLLVAAFGFLVVRGWQRGLTASILSMGRRILAFVITALFGSAFARWMNETFIYPRVYASVHERLADMAAEVSATAEGSAEAFADRLPKVFRQYLEMDAIDPTEKVSAVVDAWSRSIAGGISKVVSMVLGFALLFLLSYLVLTVAMTLVRGLVKLPIIRTVDKVLGLVGGVLSGLIAIFVLTLVLGALLSLTGHEDILDRSLLLRLFTGIKERIFS